MDAERTAMISPARSPPLHFPAPFSAAEDPVDGAGSTEEEVEEFDTASDPDEEVRNPSAAAAAVATGESMAGMPMARLSGDVETGEDSDEEGSMEEDDDDDGDEGSLPARVSPQQSLDFDDGAEEFGGGLADSAAAEAAELGERAVEVRDGDAGEALASPEPAVPGGDAEEPISGVNGVVGDGVAANPELGAAMESEARGEDPVFASDFTEEAVEVEEIDGTTEGEQGEMEEEGSFAAQDGSEVAISAENGAGDPDCLDEEPEGATEPEKDGSGFNFHEAIHIASEAENFEAEGSASMERAIEEFIRSTEVQHNLMEVHACEADSPLSPSPAINAEASETETGVSKHVEDEAGVDSADAREEEELDAGMEGAEETRDVGTEESIDSTELNCNVMEAENGEALCEEASPPLSVEPSSLADAFEDSTVALTGEDSGDGELDAAKTIEVYAPSNSNIDLGHSFDRDAENDSLAADLDTSTMNKEVDDGEALIQSSKVVALDNGDLTLAIAEDSESREIVLEFEDDADIVGDGDASLNQGVGLDMGEILDDDELLVGAVVEEEVEEVLASDETTGMVVISEISKAAKQIEEMQGVSSRSFSEELQHYAQPIAGSFASESDEEVDTDVEGEGKEVFDSAALAALLRAAAGDSSGDAARGSTRILSAERPAGLGTSSLSSVKPLPSRSNRSFPASEMVPSASEDPENSMDEEEKKLHEKVEAIRVKFLRLIRRLKLSPEDTVAAQVLYRLDLAEGVRRVRQVSRPFGYELARKKALQLEEEGKEDLDFSCNILVLGKRGVGKSATINSIFGEEKAQTNAFESSTASVNNIFGVVDGIKICVTDTPGLEASALEQSSNRKILSRIKRHTKRFPPDIILYVDRLDTQTRDLNDLPLLRSITATLGSSIWFNVVVALTHAASAPPDGPNGWPLTYEVFIAQRSHAVQQAVRHAAGDMRLMNPVALVENHPACRKNKEGEKVLPNGLSWRPQMLLLFCSSKIISEANSVLKLQDPSSAKLFGFRARSPPLPFLLSSLLQSRTHPKLSSDQGVDNGGDSDVELEDIADYDQEEGDDYDQLPPFKPLSKAQMAKLSREQRSAYLDEYDYRVKLLQKKQWKEEIRRLKEAKKRGKGKLEEYDAYGDMAAEDYDQEGAPATVPVPLPDMALPPTFDGDNPAYRYRFLEPTSQILTRPVLDPHGWDHDCGYNGISIEQNLAIIDRFPAGIAVQVTKDKKDFTIHLDSSVAARHGEAGSTLAGLDIQSVGKQFAYMFRGETKLKTFKNNKTTGGISVTFLGENVATGLKVEDEITIGKRVSMAASGGAVRSQGAIAYGANLEARLRDKDYPIGQALSTLGLSLMRWRGDVALGANLQTQFSVGRGSKMTIRTGLNNKLSGQVSIKANSSEQLQIALMGIIPVAVSVYRSIWGGEPDT